MLSYLVLGLANDKRSGISGCYEAATRRAVWDGSICEMVSWVRLTDGAL